MAIKVLSSNQISKYKSRFVEVKATAGSGKTHTLIMRLIFWYGLGVPADKILVLSYSKETVAELHRRIKCFPNKSVSQSVELANNEALDTYLSKVTVQTTHGFANGLSPKKVVLNNKMAADLLSKAIRAVQRDCKKQVLWLGVSQRVRRRRLKQLTKLAEPGNQSFVLNFLSVARASKSTVTEAAERAPFKDLIPYIAVLRAVHAKYSSFKKSKEVDDFGDMLVRATNAVRNGAAVPYTHILVDEYQDCSPAQVQFLAEVAKLNDRKIMVFGDPGQAIYGFGGSSYTPLSNALDGVIELNLPVSRRLTTQNAALASAVLRLDSEQAIQTRRGGDKPVLVCDKTETEQIRHVARDIKRLIDGGISQEQIVVLARIKALLTPVEQALLASGVQTRRKGTMRDRKHMLRVLHLVHLVSRSEKDKVAITPEKLRKVFSRQIKVTDCKWKSASIELRKVAHSPSLEGRYRLCAKIYLRLRGGVRKDANLQADVNRWEPLCREHSDAREMRDAIRAMDQLSVVTGTIHSAKGGEWEYVFIVGVTDGYLPLYLARDDKLSLSEERNLLYVAVTRARENVRLYHSPANHARSKQQFEKRSRFLDKRVLKTLQIERTAPTVAE